MLSGTQLGGELTVPTSHLCTGPATPGTQFGGDPYHASGHSLGNGATPVFSGVQF